MFLSYMMVFTTIIVYTTAVPLQLNSTHPWSLDKRATPSVAPGAYTAQEVEQLERAYKDAIQLASTVVSFSSNPARFDPIFTKYFALNDKETVLGVFKRIIDKDDGQGIDILGDIVAVADYPNPDADDEKPACDTPKDLAELYKYDTDNPELIICPKSFTFGAIGKKSWPGAPGVNCDTIYPRISRKMETLGHNVLHEYMHWDKLMSPVIKGPFGVDGTEDIDYGCYELRRITKSEAQRNADSYAWLATETFWTLTCEGSHGAFQEPLDVDN